MPSLLKRTPRWLRALQILGVLALIGLLTAGIIFWRWTSDLPNLSAIRAYAPPESTHIVDRNGVLLGEVFEERRRLATLERMPRHLLLSFLAAEDADFFLHDGFDWRGIARSALYRLLGKPLQGGSTITQQLVKLILLSPERTIRRKVREFVLAGRVEEALSKPEILALYINHVNYGHGRYGIQEAARYYFGKQPEQLTLAESALLAGLPQAPARLTPRRHPESAKRRRAYVLRQLLAKRESHWPDLDPAAVAAAKKAPITLADVPKKPRAGLPVVAATIEALDERFPRSKLARGGYTVHTTLDVKRLEQAYAVLQKGLRAVDGRVLRKPPGKTQGSDGAPRRGQARWVTLTKPLGAESGPHAKLGGIPTDISVPERYAALRSKLSWIKPGVRLRVRVTQVEDDRAAAELAMGPQGALVAADIDTGAVIAWAGAYAPGVGFDRARRAERQPGSAFKPIVYALAMESKRFTPASRILDAPVRFDTWRPANYEPWTYQGPITLRAALARSINLPAIRLANALTPTKVAEFAHKLGIGASLHQDLSLALGASEVTPWELTQAYTTLASGGIRRDLYFVDRVVDRLGATVYRHKSKPERVMSEGAAYLTTTLLRSVVTEGTGRRAAGLPFYAVGKTGTSNKARDAWFVGYSPRVVTGVWVGFDDNRALGRGEGGSSTALPIWVDWMRAAHANAPAMEPPKPPEGVVSRSIHKDTGYLTEGPGSIEEYFIRGTEPTTTQQSDTDRNAIEDAFLGSP